MTIDNEFTGNQDYITFMTSATLPAGSTNYAPPGGGGGGSTIYPATSTPNFPYGILGSSMTLTGDGIVSLQTDNFEATLTLESGLPFGGGFIAPPQIFLRDSNGVQRLLLSPLGITFDDGTTQNTAATSDNIYPATSTPNFPYGLLASSGVFTSTVTMGTTTTEQVYTTPLPRGGGIGPQTVDLYHYVQTNLDVGSSGELFIIASSAPPSAVNTAADQVRMELSPSPGNPFILFVVGPTSDPFTAAFEADKTQFGGGSAAIYNDGSAEFTGDVNMRNETLFVGNGVARFGAGAGNAHIYDTGDADFKNVAVTYGVTAGTASFSGTITASNGISATTGTYSGTITANKGISATTATISSLLTANGGIVATTGTYSGTITANKGISSTTGTFSGTITASQGISATTGTFSAGMTSTTGTFTNVLTVTSTENVSTGNLHIGGNSYTDRLRLAGYGSTTQSLRRGGQMEWLKGGTSLSSEAVSGYTFVNDDDWVTFDNRQQTSFNTKGKAGINLVTGALYTGTVQNTQVPFSQSNVLTGSDLFTFDATNLMVGGVATESLLAGPTAGNFGAPGAQIGDLSGGSSILAAGGGYVTGTVVSGIAGWFGQDGSEIQISGGAITIQSGDQDGAVRINCGQGNNCIVHGSDGDDDANVPGSAFHFELGSSGVTTQPGGTFEVGGNGVDFGSGKGGYSYFHNWNGQWNNSKFYLRVGDSYNELTANQPRYAKPGGSIFDTVTSSGNTTTVETTIFTKSITTNTLTNVGDKISFDISGTNTGSTPTKQFKVKFATTTCLDSGALALSSSGFWNVRGWLVMVSNTVVRCTATLITSIPTLSGYAGYAQIGGIVLNTNAYDLTLTGTSAGGSAASNDIVKTMGRVSWDPYANDQGFPVPEPS